MLAMLDCKGILYGGVGVCPFYGIEFWLNLLPIMNYVKLFWVLIEFWLQRSVAWLASLYTCEVDVSLTSAS